MMVNPFPFSFQPPYRKKNSNYYPPHFQGGVNNPNLQNDIKKQKHNNSDNFKNFKSSSNYNTTSKKIIENNNAQDSGEIFEIFGLKLHFDDLLIICLLFFLYEEDVKDTYLYIVLIMLLLS